MGAVKQRIDRLIDTEQCEPIEIGLCYPSWDFRLPQIPKSNILWPDIPTRSMEYPVMIVEDCHAEDFYLMASRAICHLIIFSYDGRNTQVIRDRKKQIASGD